jgi:hypothetical protein
MKKLIFIFLIFLLLLISHLSWAGTYYVNGTCTYSGNGTAESCAAGAGQAGPWKTLAEANTNVASGTHTINVAADTYVEDVSEGHSGTDSSNFLHWLASGTVNITGYFYITGDYVKLEGFTITKQGAGSGYGAVNVSGDYCYVKDNTIQNSTRPGIRTWPGSVGNTLYGNTIVTTVANGIWAEGSSHLIENNDISDVRDVYLGETYGGDANGIDIDGSANNSGTVVRGNYIHDILWANQTGSPHIDGIQRSKIGGTTSSNVTIERNRIYLWQEALDGTNTSYAMMLSGCDNWVVKNNIIESWGGVNTGGSGANSNMKFYNNTFISNIAWVNAYGGHGINMDGGSSNVAYNNILCNFRDTGRNANFMANTPTANGEFTGDNNLFWNSDSTAIDHTGYTPGGSAISGSDPVFVANYTDLQLQATSPARDAGATLGEVTDDYVGTLRPQGSGYDIGAYEDTLTSAALTGTLGDGATEAQIVTGGQTLIGIVSNDTLVATFGADNQITTDFIAGLDSGGAEVAGWDAIVKAGLTHANVSRDSTTQFTVTLPAFGSYVITQNETITLTIPASSLTESASAVVASPTFEVTATSDPAAALTGSLSDNATEAQIVAGGETIIITLTNDTWHADIGTDCQQTTDLIAGIDSAQAEAAGWDAVVKGNMVFGDITRDTDTQVTVLLGAEATYDISANETVTVTVPASALVTSGDAVVATPTFAIIFFDTSTEEVVGMTLQ